MTQTDTTEIRLYRDAANGSPQAFQEIFRQYFQPVYNYAISLSNDPALAEDLTQEAFIRAHANLDRFGPPWNFRTWIFRLTRNIFIDLTRKEKELAPLEEVYTASASDPAIEDQVILKEVAEKVRGTLQGLSPQNREVLTLREVYTLSYAEIAEVMETTPAYIKTLLHRARTSFQEAYGVRLLIDEPTEFCATVGELLHILQDGEDLGSQERLVREHLKECDACQERRRWLVVQAGMFGALVPILPPAELGTRILEQTGVSKRLRQERRNRRLRRLSGFGGAAILAGVAGWLIISGRGGGGEPDPNSLPENTAASLPRVTSTEIIPSQPPATATTSKVLSASITLTATITPFPKTLPPTINTDSLCLQGPGAQYEVVSTVTAGTQVELLGAGDLEGWLVINNPRYSIPCWLPEDTLDVNPNLDLEDLKVFPVPPPPTATATFTPVPMITIPSPPSNLFIGLVVCTSQAYSVPLNWSDNAVNETGYRVYRDGSPLATLGANASIYTDNPPYGGPYTYTIEAFNILGNSQAVNVQEAGCLP